MKTLIFSAICLTPFLSIFLAAVLPETTHHVTTKHVTTTPRPTPERYEQTNNFYLYDRDSHYFCVSHHSIRVHYHYCLCYHLPYEHRGELNDPLLLLKTEKLMFELYDAGYYVQLPLKELEYYSHRNYAMCTHTNGNPPNTTFFMVYPKPDK